MSRKIYYMTTIPIQLNEVDLGKIDYLIKIGRYKNRSQALRFLIQDRLSQETIQFEFENIEVEKKRQQIVEELLSLDVDSFFFV